jgi:putative membrane protein
MVSASLALAQGWSVGGHAVPSTWPEFLGQLGLFALAGVYVGLIVRAIVRRRWYRAEGVLGDADLALLHAELVAAERGTVGEILPVVLERSDRHPGACWLAALNLALLGSAALLGVLPSERPAVLLAFQLGLGLLGYVTASLLPDFLRLFVSASRAREQAEEQAFQEFHRYGLHETAQRTGVLLFVSLLERRAIVLADQGIAEKVEPESWARTDEAILEGIRRGSLRDGLVAGIRSAGAVLAQHFPVQEGDRNEVPDRVIVRRE